MTIAESLSVGFDTSYAADLPPWLTFDQFGRYSLIREAINAARSPLDAPRLKILDVGGYFRTVQGIEALPVLSFLPDDDVLVLDQVESELPKYRRGDGRHLDFADAEFDFVVTADTLEHVPGENRTAFIDELLRVSRYGVILLAPFKQKVVEDAETIVSEYIKIEMGLIQQQLAEHSQYGLPKLEWLEGYLTTKGIEHHSYPSGYIHSWLAMMLAKHYMLVRTSNVEAQQSIERYYIRWMAATERRTPSYRYGVVMAKYQPAPWLEAVEAAIRPTIIDTAAEPESGWEHIAQWTMALLNVERVNPQLQAHIIELLQQLAQRDAMIQHLQTIVQQQLTEQLIAEQQRSNAVDLLMAQHSHAINDLQQRGFWYAERAASAEHELKAVQQGRLMRLLRLLKGLIR